MKPDPELSSMTLYETASAWFTRRQASETWSAQLELELQSWLRADPRHRQAFQEIADVWAAFDDVPRPVLNSDKRHADSSARNRSSIGDETAGREAGRRPARGLRWWLGNRGGYMATALSICMIIGIGAWHRHNSTPQFSTYIETAHDEQREVSLPDGTVLTVNMASRLDVRLYPRRREVVLSQGEAFFDVAPDNGLPFLVKADNTQVRVLGTAFNVRSGARTHYVKVREGLVEVSSRGESEYSETLRAGEALEVDAVTGVQQRLLSAPEAAGSWRKGLLMFRNATLAEVADELSGYLGRPIELVGNDVRNRRLSGFASTRTPEGFLDALPQLLPVKVLHLPEGGYRIVASVTN